MDHCRPERDKAALYGFSLPAGTWMFAVKVNNKEVWNKVKEGEVRGFSIEGYFVDQDFGLRGGSQNALPQLPSDPETLLALKNIVLEEMEPLGMLDNMPLFATQEEAELLGELFLDCLGSHSHNLDGVEVWMPADAS